MKYVKQFMIIMIVCFLGEMLHSLLPLPVPASIYGLLILFMLLMAGLLKLEQIEEASEFFLAVMPLLFLSPSVSLITVMDKVMGAFVPVVGTIVVSTVVTIAVTGIVTQSAMKLLANRKKKCGKGGEL